MPGARVGLIGPNGHVRQPADRLSPRMPAPSASRGTSIERMSRKIACAALARTHQINTLLSEG
jgi:hypothetical protein